MRVGTWDWSAQCVLATWHTSYHENTLVVNDFTNQLKLVCESLYADSSLRVNCFGALSGALFGALVAPSFSTIEVYIATATSNP
jgi:hypothetical protein